MAQKRLRLLTSSQLIIIIIIIIIILSFMQGIYSCIPETNYVPREYSVAAILLFLFMALISLVSVLNLFYFIIIIIIIIIIDDLERKNCSYLRRESIWDVEDNSLYSSTCALDGGKWSGLLPPLGLSPLSEPSVLSTH